MYKIYTELYHEWFENEDKWFSKDPLFDKYISDKYFPHLSKDDVQSLSCDNVNKEQLIGSIIAFDQIPRHYNRICNVNCKEYTEIARQISIVLMSQLYTNLELYNSITAKELCFIFLPFRHLYDVDKINMIIDFILNKHNNEFTTSCDKVVYKKFLHYCIRDVHKLNTTKALASQKRCETVLNQENQWIKFNEILEHKPIEPILNNKTKLKIETEFKDQIKYFQSRKGTLIIVSISGGVDSFACLHLLKKHYPEENIVAVHINYNNRKECSQELSFVKQYCSIMKIRFYHREITELTRDICKENGMRDLYESSTKTIRFDTYKQVADLHNFGDNFVVLLGHNSDDCFENIITNISMKNNYKNLSGVDVLTKIEDITFWRPLLNVNKNEIVSYARIMNIPYLQDSTPKWSRRGKIRDIVLPSMKEINPDIVSSFFELKSRLSENEEIIEKYIVPNIVNKFQRLDDEITGYLSFQDLICNINIWKHVFSSQRFEFFKISYKCLKEYVAFLERFEAKYKGGYEDNHKDIDRKDMKFVIRNNIIVIMSLEKENKIKLVFKTG